MEQGITPEDIRELKDANERLIAALQDQTKISVNNTSSNNNTVPEGHWIAAWICTICCAITATVVILGKIDQVDQGRKIDRIQDHETILLQYAPSWLHNLITDSDRKNK